MCYYTEVPTAHPTCMTDWSVNISGGVPGWGSIKITQVKKDCGNPACRTSGSYDGRYEKRT
jgi:hypothetical protein